jgi:uncharacterized membrane protein
LKENIKKLSKEELVIKILENGKQLDSSQLDEEMIHELLTGKVSKDIISVHEENLTFGQRLADSIASFGGSWKFIIIFGVVLFSWIILNTLILASHAFDSYPFVFLNLVLSCIAAIQAPVIMMSQNRQSFRDRLTADNDYLVNLKSELIIEHLHYKIDELLEMKRQNEDLFNEIREIKANQLEIIKQLSDLKK